MPRMYCMVLNILTQYPLHPFQEPPRAVPAAGGRGRLPWRQRLAYGL